MTINCPWSGVLCKIVPHGGRMIMRKMVDQHKTTQVELVTDLKAVGSTNTTGNTLHRNRWKTCSTHNVSLLKNPHVQTHH